MACRRPQPRVGTIEDREVFQQGEWRERPSDRAEYSAAMRSLAFPMRFQNLAPTFYELELMSPWSLEVMP